MSENPLLHIRFDIPFDSIRAEHVEPAMARLIEDARQAQTRLALPAAPRTFGNTMEALENMTLPLDFAMSVVRHLEAVATTPELRAAYNAVQEPVSEYYSHIPLDPGLWAALREYEQTPEARQLTGVYRRLLTKTLDSFRRHGAELDAAGKARLAEIDVELSRLTMKFSENVLDATNAWELVLTDAKQLAGLPASARDAARENARSKGLESGWRFTLQAPSYLPLMTYLEDRSVREQAYRAYSSRAASGVHDNREILVNILRLRSEKARLLGFGDFADFVLVDRMAKTGAAARTFLEDLDCQSRARFEEENAELVAFRRRLEGPEAPELQPWDIGFYAEKMRAALYDFDEEDLRPYFPLEQVVAGMFDIVERLFGVKVTETPGMPVWDPQVKVYAIHDGAGLHLGSFYADWFPRENKRGGAWMDAFLTGGPLSAPGEKADFRPHLGLICGNLTPPLPDRPALLTHREVETIFHEFGHLLHHCLSRVEVRSLAGTNVAWDFVELPSQIMENWCWEKEALDLFARHYQTGETIPAELFEKMKRARTFRAANAQMRQISFGIADLALHTSFDPGRDGDVIEWSKAILQRYSAAPFPDGHATIASFTHLFSSPVGYGAGYYSYKWAEVLDADAFSLFQENGIFNAAAGARFRDTILARGDSEDPAALFRELMGRDPDPAALLRRSGLA